MEWIAHFGVGHENGGHSGRYPWGSGDRPKQDLEKPIRTLDKYKKLSKKSDLEKARKKRSEKLALSGGVAAQAKTMYQQSNVMSSKKTKTTGSNGLPSNRATHPDSMYDRFKEASKKYPNLTYTQIYKEMNADFDNDDNDYYKDLEDKWLKKHGF